MIRIRWASMKDPVVRVDDLKAWLKAKCKPVHLPGVAMHNALIGELLQEIEDAEKDG